MRVIVHLDADAFYAAVEQAADPKLRGKAIAVGGEQRGIIASASYEARKFGVYTPMPTVQARKLCPKLIVLPGDYERYEQFSSWMFGYCFDFTPDVEQTSIDEGYYELTATRKPPVEIAQKVSLAIRQKLKITVSKGIGSNKLVSAVASKLHKPAAFAQVPTGTEADFLAPLANQWLPGVGPKLSARLNAAGLARIAQVAATPVELLELVAGGQAAQIRQYARGLDERPLAQGTVAAQSYGQQETFKQDLTDEEYLSAVLRRMADELFAKVRAEGRSVRTLTVKVRYNDMAEDQCGESLLEPTDLETDIYGRLPILLRRAWQRRVSLRLVSLKLSNVYAGRFRTELPLEQTARQQLARSELARVIDDLRRRKGRQVVLRGHDLILRREAKDYSAKPFTPAKTITLRQTVTHPYVPLRLHSHYSFLDSTLSPADCVQLAAEHGCPAVALTDTGNLHGVVEFAQAAQKAGIKPIIGVELKLGTHPLLLYVRNRAGYANLCRLLSDAHTPLTSERLHPYAEGLIAVSSATSLVDIFGQRYFLPAGQRDQVFCPAVHYALPTDQSRYAIVQSIRTSTLLAQPHPQKRLAGQYHFRAPTELGRVTAHSLTLTHTLAEQCEFTVPFGPPRFPGYASPDGLSSCAYLRTLVMQGLRERYHGRNIYSDRNRLVPWPELVAQVETELAIIAEVGYEDLFLHTWDLLQTCAEHNIPWITRGSAADSLVCYCLRISDVCPIRFGLYFRRFLNRERMALHKLPDIDIDFPHDRKDDVVNLLFARHGPAHCAVVGGFSSFQARSAVADVAKVLGVAEFQIRRFTERFPWSFGSSWEAPAKIKGEGLLQMLRDSPECRDLPLDAEPFATAVRTAAFLDGVPRHPKMHPCGVVLSRPPMHELTPTFISNKGWPTTHLDMECVEALGLVKLDVLAQGGLAVIRDVQHTLAQRGVTVNVGELPWQDSKVWDYIASGNSRAVHHIESPAMISLCRMAQVHDIDGLIAIVSVIRPGAANEQKKLKFTRRYQGMEPPEYVDASLADCLHNTFGLVVYEEHILQICEAFAGLSPGRADMLRRALVKQQREPIAEIGREFTAAARQRGHADAKIQEVWELLLGFDGYAFCKAHSTAYGVEAYQSAWLKLHYPAEFMAGVLTHGKGFYHPLVYVLECHRLGIRLLPPCIQEPGPTFTVVNGAIRVPVTRMKGLSVATQERLLQEHQRGVFTSLPDFCQRVCPSAEELEALIRLGAFDTFGLSRTALFWEAQFYLRTWSQENGQQGWLLPPPSLKQLPATVLQEPTRLERLRWESELLGYAVSGHPLELYPDIAWETYCPVSRLSQFIGQEVTLCGLIIEQRVHQQVSGEPMKFLTLCDRTGMVETELFAKTYKSYGLATVRYPVLEISATVEPYENGQGFSLRVHQAGKPRGK